MSKPITIEDFISVLTDTELNEARSQREAFELEVLQSEKKIEFGRANNIPGVEEGNALHLKNSQEIREKFDEVITKMEERKDVLEKYYEAVVVGKVMLLRLRRVVKEGGAVRGPLPDFIKAVEDRIASIEVNGVIDFATLDRARIQLGLKSSAGDARAREEGMKLEKIFADFEQMNPDRRPVAKPEEDEDEELSAKQRKKKRDRDNKKARKAGTAGKEEGTATADGDAATDSAA